MSDTPLNYTKDEKANQLYVNERLFLPLKSREQYFGIASLGHFSPMPNLSNKCCLQFKK